MSGRKREKKGDGGGGGDASWMATFSDLNFLMITFFVLLLSMSSMDEVRYSDIFGDEIAQSEDNMRPQPVMGRSPLPAIVPARGSWVGYTRDLPIDDEPGSAGRHASDGIGSMQESAEAVNPDPFGERPDERLRKALDHVRDLLQLEKVSEEEIRVSVDDALLFEGEEVRPDPRSREVLQAIARLTNEVEGQLSVQSHRGDWALAAKRSAAVARALIREGVPGPRLSADVIVGEEGVLNFSIKRTISQRVTAEPTDGGSGEDDGR